jgi:hypothetical protein
VIAVGLFALLVIFLTGLVVAVANGHWPVVALFSGLTGLAAIFLVAEIAGRREAKRVGER